MRAIYKDCYWFLSSALIFLSIFLHRIHCCVCQLVLLNELYDDDNDDDDNDGCGDDDNDDNDDDNDGCGGDDDDDNDDGDDVV